MLLLVGSVFVVYLNSFTGPFLFDDYGVIVEYSPVHNFPGWLLDLHRGIRPVLKLTYLLNWISGMGPAGFHLFNICVHALNSALVYELAARFMERGPNPSSAGKNMPALLTAMFFALHPVQTEAVSYISGRSASLMAFFYLASLLAYVRGSKGNNTTLLYLASPLFFLLAVATKETALTLPFALALWEATNRQDRCLTILKRQAVHWLLVALLVFLVLAHPGYGRLLWFSLDLRSLHDNLLSQINGVTYLLSRLIWFHRLNIDPDIPVISRWTPFLALQSCLLAGMLAAAIVMRRKRPWIFFGIAWFFLSLFPTNSVIPRLDIANERHLYLADFGIFLVFGAEIAGLMNVKGKWVRAAVVVLMLILGAVTVVRNNVYRSGVALWEDTAQKSPHKSRVFNNLGYSYELEGRREEAAAMYDKALGLDPGNSVARYNLMRLEHLRKREGRLR